MSTPAVPARAECVRNFAAAYRSAWDEVWEDIRRRGPGPAAETAIDPERARRRLEEIQAAARAGKAA